MLERAGHRVSSAASAESGMDLAKTERPDLILMDVIMPGMNGFQATRQIARNTEIGHIPVVIVSTKDQETDRVWGRRQGAKDYLTKPVDEANLIQIIAKFLPQ